MKKWIVEFNETGGIVKDFSGQSLTKELIEEIRLLDKKVHSLNQVTDEGYFKCFFKNEEETIRVDIGDGNAVNKKTFDYLLQQIQQMEKVEAYKYTLQMKKEESFPFSFQLSSIKEAAETLKKEIFLAMAEEYFYILCLDTKHTVIGVFEVSHGSINASIVHPREIFKRALLCNSNQIFLAHNHPSGDPTPSSEDISITKRLVEAGKLLGVEVLDHIILGDENYTSLQEEGYL